MATKTLTSRIILRNDTANNWTTNNPVLLKGEIGLETDTGKYKIGDGTSNWQALQYYVNLDQDSKTSLDTLIEMLDDDSFGKVNDVQVNGTTVVENKVANVSIGVLTTSATAQSEVTSGESFTNNIVLHKVAKTGNYNDLLNKLNVVDNLNSTSATDALSANQGNTLKNMVQALPSAKSFTNIQAMITAINSYSNAEMNVGTSIFLQQMNVPDFWVYSKSETSVPYTYTDDSAFLDAFEISGYVQVGYYNIAMLETAKVDLTDYVDLTSDQTITGTKTVNKLLFSDDIELLKESGNAGIVIGSRTTNYIPNGLVAIGINTDSFSATAQGQVIIGWLAKGGGISDIAIGTRATNNATNSSYGAVAIGAFANTYRECIAIGDNAIAGDESKPYSIAIGRKTEAKGNNAISIGAMSKSSGNSSIQLGYGESTGDSAIAVGYNASSQANNAIQLGEGTNINENTFNVWDYQILSKNTGKIPNERLNDNILITTDTLILDGGTSTITQ